MKLSKSLGLVAILGMLIPSPAALASNGTGHSSKSKPEKPPKPEKEKHKNSDPVHSVPEPATIGLLGAAAGVAGARKLWQKRRASRSR
jgi:hypothetical protein